MEQLLSPKQVARAIDVSESSLKRWCDQGLIPTTRTAGGHRRLPIAGVLEFIRKQDRAVVRPEVLGLPATSGTSRRTVERSRDELVAALLAGDELRCRQVLFDAYLAGKSIATLGDQVLAPAFEQIGEKWACGDAEIYQERRSCEIATRSMLELSQGIPQPESTAKLAIGAAVWGDFSQLPTLLVEMVFRSRGWQASSLGSGLPGSTLSAAVDSLQPTVFWLSVSYVNDPEDFLAEYTRLHAAIDPNVQVVVGGRALNPSLLEHMNYDLHCAKLSDLEQFLVSKPENGSV